MPDDILQKYRQFTGQDFPIWNGVSAVNACEPPTISGYPKKTARAIRSTPNRIGAKNTSGNVAWYEESLAYFISEEGMSEFERKRSNLAQGIYHAAELLKSGIITRAEFEAEKTRFEERLARLRPSVQSEAQLAMPLLHDFAALWQQMTPAEHKGMLQCMLVGAYFDGLNLKHVIANEPFDQLLDLT